MSGLTRRTILAAGAATGWALAAELARARGPGLSGAGAAMGAGAECWPSIPAPRPPRIPHRIEQLGRVRDDPYAWMKYVPETGTRTLDTMPPPIAGALRQEMAYAQEMLAPTDARRDALLAAMLARAEGAGGPPPLPQGKWRYTTIMPEGTERPVHIRERRDGTREPLVDENARAEGHAYYRATDFQPSPDQRYYAWAEDVIGNDRHRIAVLDTVTGEIRIMVPDDAYGYGGLTFGPGSHWLFWIKRDARNRPTQLLRSAVDGDGAATLVYEESDPAIFMQLSRSAQDGYVVLDLAGPDMAEVRLIPAGAETRAPLVVAPRRRGTTYSVHEWRGGLVALTDADGAIENKVVRIDPRTLAAGTTLVPHRADRQIVALYPFAAGLVRLEREGGLQRLVIQHADGRALPVPFAGPAYALSVPPGQDYASSSVRVAYETPATPTTWYDIALADGARREAGAMHLSGYDPDDYMVERLEARASDGALVPLTVLSRRDAPRDGTTPLLLHGYGAYGVSSDPVFSLPATVLVDAGWHYAIAHVRGGSEKGRQWFLDGRRFAKGNSMTDFLACARHLTKVGYAAPRRIAAFGLSAGGLLVGGAMNLAPGMWSAVIAKVPFFDMLNTMSDADHPLVPLFRPDWGDPLVDPRAYDCLASISPYDNVRPAPYPPLLTTAGLKDDRVSYWEPWKLVAAMRRASTSGAPAILALDPEAGHQGSADLASEFGEMARFWAFAEHALGCAGAG